VTRTADSVVRPDHLGCRGAFGCCGEVNNSPSEGRAPEGVGTVPSAPRAHTRGRAAHFAIPWEGIVYPPPSGRPGSPDEAHVPTEHTEAGQEARLPSSHVDARRTGHPEGPASKGPPPAVGLSGPIWRIRDRATFVALRRSNRRVRRGPITVTWAPGGPADPPRVAYAIGKHVGGATVRNRIRRRLRAIVRDLERPLGPGAWLIGTAPEVAKLSYGKLKTAVAEAGGALEDRG
jgi:ribonuclease P protein component